MTKLSLGTLKKLCISFADMDAPEDVQRNYGISPSRALTILNLKTFMHPNTKSDCTGKNKAAKYLYFVKPLHV